MLSSKKWNLPVDKTESVVFLSGRFSLYLEDPLSHIMSRRGAIDSVVQLVMSDVVFLVKLIISLRLQFIDFTWK